MRRRTQTAADADSAWGDGGGNGHLAKLGYGAWAPGISADVLGGFVERLDEYETTLAGYAQDGNTTALRQISENLAYAAGSAIAARAKSRAPKAGRRATFG